MFEINGKDMAHLLRHLHMARIDANDFFEAEADESRKEAYRAALGAEVASSAGILCTVLEGLLHNKDNWKD
jgi:hypothetical protein